MVSETQQTRFNSLVSQTIVGIGNDVQTESLRRALQSLNFVQFRTCKLQSDFDISAHFIIAAVDFSNSSALQALARLLQNLDGHKGVKLLFAINPMQLSNEELLFGVELDVKRTFFGQKRDEDLRAYIKQRALETTEVGSMAHVEAEVHKAIEKHDHNTVNLWSSRLSQMDKTSEDVNRLLALLAEERRDYKRFVFHLKQTLTANPQNLWAANRLGTYYIKNRQVAEGIAILKKMSRFHELNSERMLVLGDAFLNVGKAAEAQRVLQRGQELIGEPDARFTEALVKSEFLIGETSKALERSGRRYLSNAVISFLNTRAVLTVKNQNFEEGMRLYKQALAGCNPEESIVLAKVLFNQGLAFVRNHEPELAEAAFIKSLELGGSSFNRAAKPLAITKQLVVQQKKLTPQALHQKNLVKDIQALEDFEFESVGHKARSTGF